MKRSLAGFGASLALAAHAQQPAIPSGYEMDNPRILAQQLLWGVVHGVRLLGMACQRRGDNAATLAYAEWLDRQWPRIRAAEVDLSRHYFQREQVPMEAIDGALKLKPALDQLDGELGEACASLPEALATPRYDLERYYQEKLKQ
ncbi:MAG TPA: hypothetical protein VFF82_03970 [Rhodocyclaceae bacterium]|nr:hypothetical protein [Rhodocyclaceae bacterium]